MSVPDPEPARKPRRLGLYAPFILALLAFAAWSGFWLWASGRASQGLDDTARNLREAGYEVSWKTKAVYGYPFRLDVTLTEARVRDPSGWGLASPRLEAESYLHALGQWVMAAPDGLSVLRPAGGAVNVTGEVIHASLGKLDRHPPNFSFEGVKLAFAPAPGAQPFALSAADKLQLHLRAGPDDQGAVLVRVDGGKAYAGGVMARIAGDKPVSLVWDSTLSTMKAFKGDDWSTAARAWSLGGGTIVVREAGLTAGDAALNVQSGSLAAGADGRLRGDLSVELRNAPAALAAMAQSGVIPRDAADAATVVAAARQGSGDTARADLVFQAGRVTLGPVALGAAPRLF